MSVQRNYTHVLFFLTPPVIDAFDWNYTLLDGDNKAVSPFFCEAYTATVTEKLIYHNSTPTVGNNYTRMAAFEYSNETAIYISDLTNKKIDILVFTTPLPDYKVIDTGNPNDVLGGHRLLATQNSSQTGPFVNKINTEFTLVDFSYTDATAVQSHHLLRINETSLLISVDGEFQIYEVNLDQLTRKTIVSIDLVDSKAMIAYKNYLFVGSTQIRVYNLNTDTFPLVETLTAASFGYVDINIVSFAIDNETQTLFALDTVHGVLSIDISQLPTIGNKKLLSQKTQIGGLTRLALGGKGVLFIESSDDAGSSWIYELMSDNPSSPQTAQYSVIRKHSLLPGIKHLSADKYVGVTTIDNVINVYLAGLPTEIVPSLDTTGKDISISLIGVQLSGLFHIGPQTFLFSAGTTQHTVHQISVNAPYAACMPTAEAAKETYKLNGTIWTMNCSRKANASDTSPENYCLTNVIISVEVWESVLSSPKVGLAVGLTIGLLVAAVAIIFCIRYQRKVKRYRQLLNEGENAQRLAKAQEKRSPRDQANKYPGEQQKSDREKEGLQGPDIEIQLAHNMHDDVPRHDQENPYGPAEHNQFDMGEGDQNMDEIYKDE